MTPFPTLDPETVENSGESDSENGRVTEVNRKTLNLESNENDPWGAALKEGKVSEPQIISVCFEFFKSSSGSPKNNLRLERLILDPKLRSVA